MVDEITFQIDVGLVTEGGLVAARWTGVGRTADSELSFFGNGGRAIAALARDPDVLAKSGEVLTAGGLAREYEFTDIEGTQPEPFTLAGEQAGPS